MFKRRLRRWEFSDGEESLESHIVETLTYSPEEDAEWMHNTHGQNLRIAEIVAKGLPLEVPARDAYETMRLCFAAEQSEEEGRVILLRKDGNLAEMEQN